MHKLWSRSNFIWCGRFPDQCIPNSPLVTHCRVSTSTSIWSAFSSSATFTAFSFASARPNRAGVSAASANGGKLIPRGRRTSPWPWESLGNKDIPSAANHTQAASTSVLEPLVSCVSSCCSLQEVYVSQCCIVHYSLTPLMEGPLLSLSS